MFWRIGEEEKARSLLSKENMPPQSVFMSGQRPICHPTPSTAAQSPSHELRERRAREWSGEFRTAAAVEWGCKITRRPPSLHPLFAALYYQKEINRLGRLRPPSHCSSPLLSLTRIGSEAWSASVRGDRVKFDGVRMRQRLNGERGADGGRFIRPSPTIQRSGSATSPREQGRRTTEPKFAMILALAQGG